MAARQPPDEPIEPIRRISIEREVPPLPEGMDPTIEEVGQLKSVIAVRESQLAQQVLETNELRVQLTDLSTRFEEAQTARARAEGELQQVRVTVDSIVAEREALRRRIEEVSAEFDTRLSDTVRTALAEQAQEHEAERQQLLDERLKLRTELDSATAERDDVKRQLEQSGAEATTPAEDLAARFAGVLSELAEQPSPPDRPYSVALTTMDVEARGVLHMEDDKPQLVTSRAGKDPGQLSTVRMQFRAVPRIPGSAPPPET
jgi:uncharacterized protein YhaN